MKRFLILLIVLAACKDNTVQNVPDDSEYVSIAGVWTGAFKVVGTIGDYSKPCAITITNNNNVYTIAVNDYNKDFAKFYNGIYRCINFTDPKNKYVKYALISEEPDTIKISYDSEEIYTGVLTSYTLINSEGGIFCYKE